MKQMDAMNNKGLDPVVLGGWCDPCASSASTDLPEKSNSGLYPGSYPWKTGMKMHFLSLNSRIKKISVE